MERQPPSPETPAPAPACGGWAFWLGSVALLGWVLGCALQLGEPVLAPAGRYAGLLAASLGAGLALVWVGRRRSSKAGAVLGWGSVFVLALGLGFSQTGLRAVWLAQQALPASLEGQRLVLTGMVAAMPTRQAQGLRFVFDVAEARTLAGEPVHVPARVLLGWWGGPQLAADGERFDVYRQPADLRAGEVWRFTATLRAPHGSRNPHCFDAELWLWEQGIRATGSVRVALRDAPPQRLEATARHPVEQARQAVRDAIEDRVGAGSTPDDDGDTEAAGRARARIAGVLAALVTGDQSSIEHADWEVFRTTGVAHLMSISGLHITLFAWAAGLVVGALWRRSARLCLWLPAPTAAAVGGLLLAAAYAGFAGWGVPAQRTVLMLAVMVALRLLGRPWPWPTVWLLALAVVVALDPWALLQAGFWLSFVAVGVLFATDLKAQEDRNTPVKRLILSKVSALLREQGVVTLALTPLTLLLFGQVSLVGLLANLVAIPWVTLVVTPLALGGVLAPPLWTLSAWALTPLMALLEALSALPWATLSVPAAPWWVGAVGVVGALLLVLRLPVPVRLMGLPLLLPVLLWPVARPAPGQFELLAADIGQGNAVLVRTAGHTLLYDSGPRFSSGSDAGTRVLVPLLRALGEPVDMVLLSHRDADHTGGARAVLRMQPRATLLSSIEPEHELQAVRPATRCVAGQRWVWDGVRFEVLHPVPEDYATARKTNALSCVLHVDNGEHRALLVGDIEAAQEAAVLARAGQAQALRSDVLLVPHHGSKTSSTAAFLDAVAPRWALVQAGYRNRYGHPAPEVLARYQARGIQVIDSVHCGAAQWSSAEPGRMVCERERVPHYWQHRAPPLGNAE
ncbi:competence protein ComEC [Tibeticola sediminis]|uniref:Competence protein ComEC n=1 Tax=Tibeticola sediminis TaxID=1917811 RepID=A0A3N4UQ47_9BURK|nr:DNA internalization-related competence protein ComEC/Rec2 [Tibeticola sediminis]RPE72786.1 competence protein ComEC [Tibeticola sediminis]